MLRPDQTKGKGKEKKAAPLNQPTSPVFVHPSFKRSKRSKRIPRTHASDRQTEHVHKPLLLLSMQSMYVKHTNERRKKRYFCAIIRQSGVISSKT